MKGTIMSEKSAVEENAQTEPQPKSLTGECDQARTDPSKQIFMALCALGLVGCFFLPWISFLLATLSAYQLQEIPATEIRLLWLIPVTALCLLGSILMKRGVRLAALIAGVTPFLALLYYLAKYGADLFQSLKVGAVLTLCLAGLLLISCGFPKTSKP